MLRYRWKGLVPYSDFLIEQNKLVQKVRNENLDGFVLGYEHPTVITLGVRGDKSKDIKVGLDTPVYTVRRGGQATLHSPGQLLIYPLVNLKKLKIGARDFVYYLQKSIIKTLNQYMVEAFTKEKEPGVYADKGKIAFIGIQISKGISMHGISININNDLSLFEQIVSCGWEQPCLDQLNVEIDSKVFFEAFKKHLIIS